MAGQSDGETVGQRDNVQMDLRYSGIFSYFSEWYMLSVASGLIGYCRSAADFKC